MMLRPPPHLHPEGEGQLKTLAYLQQPFMIYYDKVSKIYHGGAALEDINFSVEPGEFVSIVGHSGAGKTTLMKMLLAEEQPTSGAVFFQSANVHEVPRKTLNEIYEDGERDLATLSVAARQIRSMTRTSGTGSTA